MSLRSLCSTSTRLLVASIIHTNHLYEEDNLTHWSLLINVFKGIVQLSSVCKTVRKEAFFSRYHIKDNVDKFTLKGSLSISEHNGSLIMEATLTVF